MTWANVWAMCKGEKLTEHVFNTNYWDHKIKILFNALMLFAFSQKPWNYGIFFFQIIQFSTYLCCFRCVRAKEEIGSLYEEESGKR